MITPDRTSTPCHKFLQAYQTQSAIVTVAVSILVTLAISHLTSNTCSSGGPSEPVRRSENGVWAYLIIFIVGLSSSASLNAILLPWMQPKAPQLTQNTQASVTFSAFRARQEIIAAFGDLCVLDFTRFGLGLYCRFECHGHLMGQYFYAPTDNFCIALVNGTTHIDDNTHEVWVEDTCFVLTGTVAEKGAGFFRYWNLVHRKDLPPAYCA
ncbi:hypothetical protein DICA1_A01244 [Diutina catenulata]